MNQEATIIAEPGRSTPPSPQDRWMTRAWWAVAAIPVFAVLAFVVGEVTLSAFGYSSGGDEPVWVALIVDLVTLVVWFMPCVAAVVFGRLARRSGVRRAVVPMVIGAVVGTAGLALTVVTEIGNAI